MTLTELADRLEPLDEDAFASLLNFETSHDDVPRQAKQMLIAALRFSHENGLTLPSAHLDAAD